LDIKFKRIKQKLYIYIYIYLSIQVNSVSFNKLD